MGYPDNPKYPNIQNKIITSPNPRSASAAYIIGRSYRRLPRVLSLGSRFSRLFDPESIASDIRKELHVRVSCGARTAEFSLR
jgi:hypothetical protein